MMPPIKRIVDVYVVDARDHALPDAEVSFFLNDHYAGKVPNANGHGNIRLSDRDDVLKVSVTYRGETKEFPLSQSQDNLTVRFDVNYLGAFMEKHLPLAVGIFFVLLSLVLGFAFANPTVLQTRLILGTWALAAGGIATEIPGTLGFNFTLGQKIAVGATGAIAVFAILYLMKPA